MQFHANAAIYTIPVIATAGVIIRPWRFPEAIWAVLGAVALVAFGLISLADAVTGILRAWTCIISLPAWCYSQSLPGAKACSTGSRRSQPSTQRGPHNGSLH